MNRIHIVGAGPSGLVAAIILARAGREVLVLEKEKIAGGDPETHPRVDMTPFDFEGLQKLTGIAFSPAVKPLQQLRGYVWGRPYLLDPAPVSILERGLRPTSIDSYLFGLAQDAGVKFEFSRFLQSAEDFARLPAGSIIATGPHLEGFRALGVPHQITYSYAGLAQTPPDLNQVACYFGDFTRDYAYVAAINGVAFTLLFSRRPLGEEHRAAYAELLERTEGIKIGKWRNRIGPLPTASRFNPRLWHRGRILAGTLGGVMDPFLLFGMHGAILSGWISAMAVLNPPAAERAFARHRRLFARTLLVKRLADTLPFRKQIFQFLIPNLNRLQRGLPLAIGGIPGYRWDRPWQEKAWMRLLKPG